MSLTSYRAAPPRAMCKSRRDLSRLSKRLWRFTHTARANCFCNLSRVFLPMHSNTKGRFVSGPFVTAWAVEFVMRRLFYISCVLQTWQRPTLPRLKTKYHGRRGVSRPCSERERVQPPRHNHQVGKAQLCCFEKLVH